MSNADWLLAIATVILAWATYRMANQTRDLVRLSSLIEETRLSIEQNWKLWEHRNEIWTPVAPRLTDAEWKWRLGILNHLNLLQFAYRRFTHGIDKSRSRESLDSWIIKAKRAIGQAKGDKTGAAQLRQLLQRGEGFPQDFIDWMQKEGIITGSDYL